MFQRHPPNPTLGMSPPPPRRHPAVPLDLSLECRNMARASRLSVGSSLDSESSSLIDDDTEYSVSPYCKLPPLPATQSVRIHRFVNQGGAEIIRKDFFTFNIKQTTLLGDNVVETSSKSCTVILNPDGTIQSTGCQSSRQNNARRAVGRAPHHRPRRQGKPVKPAPS
ncbi:hypothetical protein J6590_046885 [Homalodisca vitripennis]|nr:hypothetical protein J6590_046885 [Homalodisca vitripennis]